MAAAHLQLDNSADQIRTEVETANNRSKQCFSLCIEVLSPTNFNVYTCG